MQHRPKAWDQ